MNARLSKSQAGAEEQTNHNATVLKPAECIFSACDSGNWIESEVKSELCLLLRRFDYH